LHFTISFSFLCNSFCIFGAFCSFFLHLCIF
jgi:hypothetical protein